MLYGVPAQNYLIKAANQYKCEVKLRGRCNPEGEDVVIARGSKVFVADKLSDTNKKQLESLHIQWVELRNKREFERFAMVLQHLNIPHKKLPANVDDKLAAIFVKNF